MFDSIVLIPNRVVYSWATCSIYKQKLAESSNLLTSNGKCSLVTFQFVRVKSIQTTVKCEIDLSLGFNLSQSRKIKSCNKCTRMICISFNCEDAKESKRVVFSTNVIARVWFNQNPCHVAALHRYYPRLGGFKQVANLITKKLVNSQADSSAESAPPPLSCDRMTAKIQLE